MQGYIFETQGKQFSPDGIVEPPMDAAEHNKALDELTCEAMRQGLPIVLYLTEEKRGHGVYYRHIGTWAGTWKIETVYVKTSWHNFAGRDGRRDVWFNAFGHNWHGVNIGDNMILRCKTVKK